jgi:hypothetical protein
MKALKMMLVCAAFAGCASMYSSARRDPAAGKWVGVLDRNGWPEVVGFRIENENGTWQGEWQSGGVTEPLQNVTVTGDSVRFESGKLLIAGRVDGSKLSGTVFAKDTGIAEGEFSLEREHLHYSPASEPSFAGMVR